MNHLKRRLGRTKYHRLKAVVRIVVVLLLCVGVIGVAVWDHSRRNQEGVVEADDADSEGVYYNGSRYLPKKNLETLLLIGEDKFLNQQEEESYVNTKQADFLLLLIMDKENGTCQVLQLNRDTMTQIESYGVAGESAGTYEGQLALAHTYGSGGQDSCRYQAIAVSNLLYGVSIDHFCSVTMDAVAVINDAVGGVSVQVMDDMTMVDPSFVQGETVTLEGEQALKYVRNRKELDDTTNLHRMERQRQYMQALYEKLMACVDGDAGFTAKLLLAVNDYVTSDCSVTQLQELADFLTACDMPDIDTIDGENVKGEEFMEFYPDEDQLRQYVMDHFYTKENPTTEQ